MRKDFTKALSFSVIIGILGIISTCFLSLKVNDQIQKENYLKIENIAKQISIHFQAAIDMSTNDLQALQAFYSATPKDKSIQDFNHYMQVLDIENRNHIQALSWIPLISATNRDKFIERMNFQYPNFNIIERNNQGEIVKSSDKAFYTPVAYISPYQTNKGAHGFDLSSSDTRRISLEYARDHGKMTTTAKIKLIQEKEDSYGFLIIAPVYDIHASLNTTQERTKALLGYVTGVFRINSLMEIAKQQADKEGLILTLLDKDAVTGGILYGPQQEKAAFSFNQIIPDRHWQLNITPTPELKNAIASHEIVNGIIASGFIISLLLAVSLYALQASIIRARRIHNLSEALQAQNIKLEATVAERTQKLALNNELLNKHVDELARSNQELDDFAHIASHDLKAPLRGIDQLANWIAEDIEENNLTEVPENIRLMRSRVQRLEYLLNDLLEYSRANRVTHKPSKINCHHLFTEIFELIAPPQGFQLTIENNIPEISTLSAPFAQVVRNLLNNAIKHHDKTTGCINIHFKDKQDFYQFSITDDGPGISAKHQKQIFKMFKTLKSRDEVEGSGIGLALVKKIVEFYSGTIKVESIEGEGSTFYFTWPKNIQ